MSETPSPYPIRVDVHLGSTTFMHDRCPNPSFCDCECLDCKRTWERACRPSPIRPRDSDKRDFEVNMRDRLSKSIGKSEFQAFVRAALISRTATELAGRLKVSRTTVSRWASGQSAPHPIGRPSVIEVLEGLI